MIALTALLALLLLASWWQWQRVRYDESPQVRAQHAGHAALDRGMVDDHACEMCHEVTAVRECVRLYDDAALCCLHCAPLLTARPAREAA